MRTPEDATQATFIRSHTPQFLLIKFLAALVFSQSLVDVLVCFGSCSSFSGQPDSWWILWWGGWPGPGPAAATHLQTMTHPPPCFPVGMSFCSWNAASGWRQHVLCSAVQWWCFRPICPQNIIPEVLVFVSVLSGELIYKAGIDTKTGVRQF